MRGKRALTPEEEAKLLRLDDLRYSLRDKNLAIGFGIPEQTLRVILHRLRRQRRERAEQEFQQICDSGA
jgi:hypothetical protein